jgi:hypothetical protein
LQNLLDGTDYKRVALFAHSKIAAKGNLSHEAKRPDRPALKFSDPLSEAW